MHKELLAEANEEHFYSLAIMHHKQGQHVHPTPLCHLFTAYAMERFNAERILSAKYDVNVEVASAVWKVSRDGAHRVVKRVGDVFTCTCMELGASGIPCRHIARVVEKHYPEADFDRIMAKIFHVRWSLAVTLSSTTLRRVFEYRVRVFQCSCDVFSPYSGVYLYHSRSCSRREHKELKRLATRKEVRNWRVKVPHLTRMTRMRRRCLELTM